MRVGSSQFGTGGPTRPPLLVGVLATAMLVAACSGASSSTTSVETSEQTSTSTTRPTDPPTTSSSTTTLATPATVPEDELAAAWTSYWEGWAEVRASDDLNPAPLEAVASAEVVEGAIALFERQRSSGQGPVETDFELHPAIENSAPDRVTVEDCVLLMPSFTEAVGVWHEADLVRTDQGWIVDDVRIRSTAGCIPEAMAEAAIAGYEAYYEAEAEFWDPADPTSPLIDGVLADPQKSFIVDLLEEHQSQGVALRGQPTVHPEVIEVRSPVEVVILSCSEPDPNYGLYDIDTGERLPDEPPVEDGQRDLQSAVMVLDGDLWKVSDLQGQVDFECEFAPTDRGLPSV